MQQNTNLTVAEIRYVRRWAPRYNWKLEKHNMHIVRLLVVRIITFLIIYLKAAVR